MTGGRDTTAPRRILSDSRIDDVATAIIALTREVWVLCDRQAVLEHLLDQAGIDVASIDTYKPDPAMEAKLGERRQRMLDNVLRALGVDETD